LSKDSNSALAGSARLWPRLVFSLPRHLLGRLYFLAATLCADCLLLATISRRAAIFGILAPFGIVTFAVFLGLGYTALKADRVEIPFHKRWYIYHLAGVLLIWLPYVIAPRGPKYHPYAAPAHIFASGVLLVSVTLLALSCLPLQAWMRAFRITNPIWLIATLAGLVAAFLRSPLQAMWGNPLIGGGSALQAIAFRSVDAVLRIFLPNVIVDPQTYIIGTQRFAVTVREQCSGLEGLGLVLVFTVVWLWYFRKENRFPQALLLIPVAMLFVWVLNIVRICAIILIGNAGAGDIAMVGFHSQAGWIAFTGVALTFSMATRKLSWVRAMPADGVHHPEISATGGSKIAVHTESGESSATGAYLVPFLAILAASFVSKAASGSFEWLYPLRFLAAAIAIWHFRHEYKKLDWRFGWLAPVTGLAIFLVWIAPEWLKKEDAANTLGTALSALAPNARVAWIAFRTAAAVITVPIAEELAFRGYLTRRLMSRHFDEVPFRTLSILSVCISSALFGAMHGRHWLAGIVAGLAFAGVLKWRGRMGDAVIAHATSNLLLAAWVLLRGDWGQW
jgi:exosortase E/protease (VPEID-CTERM system)